MITIQRAEFKTDPVWKLLYQCLVSKHKVASHTERVLISNKHIQDFCEEAEHFGLFPFPSGDIYVKYSVSSWFKEPYGVQVRIDTIYIYDTLDEYESDRRKCLNSTIHADGANLN